MALRMMAVCAVLLFMLVSGVAASDTRSFEFPPIPKGHWTLSALDRLMTDWSSVLNVPNYREHPFTRGWFTRYEAAETIRLLSDKLINNDQFTSKVRPAQLSALKALTQEFSPELTAIGADVKAIERDLHALREDRLRTLVQDNPELAEMPVDHWAYESMKLMYQLGIFRGYPAEKEGM